ncbi:MAG: hypothetical protein NTZ39_00510 [Methanoregula sp.]|nr:hypothetical protein [Methanoregula sp.]
MKNDPQDIFQQMDAMMAQLFRTMDDRDSSNLPQMTGYHIVIDGSSQPPEPTGSPAYPSRDTDEPVAEVHRIGTEVKVVVEMPGISEENLNIQLNGDTLTIEAAGNTRTYSTKTNLPPIDPVSRQHTLKNGVLEVTFESLSGSPEADKS